MNKYNPKSTNRKIHIERIQTRKCNSGNSPREIQIGKDNSNKTENTKQEKSGKSKRKRQFEPIQIGKYKSKNKTRSEKQKRQK